MGGSSRYEKTNRGGKACWELLNKSIFFSRRSWNLKEQLLLMLSLGKKKCCFHDLLWQLAHLKVYDEHDGLNSCKLQFQESKEETQKCVSMVWVCSNNQWSYLHEKYIIKKQLSGEQWQPPDSESPHTLSKPIKFIKRISKITQLLFTLTKYALKYLKVKGHDVCYLPSNFSKEKNLLTFQAWSFILASSIVHSFSDYHSTSTSVIDALFKMPSVWYMPGRYSINKCIFLHSKDTDIQFHKAMRILLIFIAVHLNTCCNDFAG